jgi:uncharacterized protein YdaU (DUF1376 family)
MSAIQNMPLDTSAYLSDTGHLSTFEHGAYLLLLMAMWRSADGWLSNDDVYLARATHLTADKWRRIAPTVRALLKVDGSRISQKRLLKTKSQNPGLDSSTAPKSLKHKEAGQNHAEIAPSLLPPTDSVDSKEERKKGRSLPENWQPRAQERNYGLSIGLANAQIDRAAEKMRRWAVANAHRPVARKSNWELTFRNWLDGEVSGRFNGHGQRAAASGPTMFDIATGNHRPGENQ